MVSDRLTEAISESGTPVPDGLDYSAVDRVLTEPEQERLAEALAADAVDAVPIVGDLLAITRMEKAEERNVEYPSRPEALENAISDLPPPVDTIGDIIIAQNTMSYLSERYNLPLSGDPTDPVGEAAEGVDAAVDSILPGGGDST